MQVSTSADAELASTRSGYCPIRPLRGVAAWQASGTGWSALARRPVSVRNGWPRWWAWSAPRSCAGNAARPVRNPGLARNSRALGISDQALSELLGESVEPEGATSASGPIAGEAASPYHQDLLEHSVVFPALGFDELRHLGAAFDDARRYFDIEVVGYFKKQMNDCAANDGAYGPAQVLPIVLGMVTAIELRAREVKPDVRRELLTVGAQAAEFVGWLYRDARPPRLASHWRDRATEWAQEAGDRPMQGYLLLKKSQAAWDERDGLLG